MSTVPETPGLFIFKTYQQMKAHRLGNESRVIKVKGH